jgi:hypothetical protein
MFDGSKPITTKELAAVVDGVDWGQYLDTNPYY